MSRQAVYLLALVLITLPLRLSGQISSSCPVVMTDDNFENPLNEKWLSAYDVRHYELDLSVDNTSTVIDGSATILVRATRRLDTLVLELQDALEVSRVLFSEELTGEDLTFSTELSFEHRDQVLYIALDRAREMGELFRIKVYYGGEAGQNRGFFAGINSATDYNYGFDVTYTLSEPHNARDWFPAKQVLSDKIDSVTFRIHCSTDLLAGSNGVLTEVKEKGDSSHILTWKTRYPVAYYLISFAVADYQDYSFQAPLSRGSDSVLVQNFIYDDPDVLEDWGEQIRATASMITSFSELFGDYPFSEEKYGHSMAPMGGGMEHQTMTTLHDFSFSLVAHELAHQWFGDYVTCGNWQDIWINEGFASYCEYIAAQELLGQYAADVWMQNAVSVAMNERDGSVYVPEDQVGDDYRLFDYGLSYKKGATLLHMIRFILDDDPLFFRVLRTYLETYGKGLATGEDFRTVLEEVSGMDFSCFFAQWYYGEGFPSFRINWVQSGDTLRILSEQSTSAPESTPLFQVPFELEIRFADQPPERIRLQQEENSQQFSIPVEGLVEEVIFDPDGFLLASSSVIQSWPNGTVLRFGPNPVTGEIFIQVPNSDRIEELKITSITGKEVMFMTDLENPVTMDLTDLADGSYFIELSSALGTFQEQIVKVNTSKIP
jgi:aminopeptidase N